MEANGAMGLDLRQWRSFPSRRPRFFAGTGAKDFAEVKMALVESLKRALWKKAAKHHNGEGLQEIPFLKIREHLKNLRRAGKHHMYGAILAGVTAATWPRKKLSEYGIPCDDVMCKRCGRRPESDYHRIWECDANEKLPACIETDRLKWMAKSFHASRPSLWLRGLAPESWFEVEPAPLDPAVYVARMPKSDGACIGEKYWRRRCVWRKTL